MGRKRKEERCFHIYHTTYCATAFAFSIAITIYYHYTVLIKLLYFICIHRYPILFYLVFYHTILYQIRYHIPHITTHKSPITEIVVYSLESQILLIVVYTYQEQEQHQGKVRYIGRYHMQWYLFF